MPIYEYRCGYCGHNFEMILPFSESFTKTQCPECKRNDAKRVVSVFGIQFKGKGFYNTDNRKESKDV